VSVQPQVVSLNPSYGVIYKITNVVNGKIYIGQTSTSTSQRWREHVSDSRSPKRRFYLHAAILKYGVENFISEVLGSASTKQELDLLEKLWIAGLNTTNPQKGYNCTSGGGACVHGPSSRALTAPGPTRETVAKIVAATKGKKKPQQSEPMKKFWKTQREYMLAARQTPEAKLNRAEAQKKIWTPEKRAAFIPSFREACIAYWQTSEAKVQASERMKRRWAEWRANGRAQQHAEMTGKRSKEWWSKEENHKLYTDTIWNEEKRAEARQKSNEFFSSVQGVAAKEAIKKSLKKRYDGLSESERMAIVQKAWDASLVCRRTKRQAREEAA
jgi:group I intron endonuclease